MGDATQHFAFNSHVEALLAQGEFAIDLEKGLAALANYWHEVALVSSGVPYSEIGFSRRRLASLPQLLVPSTAGYKTVTSSDLFWDDVPKGSILQLKLRGVMQEADGMSSRGVESLVEDLRLAYSNENVSAILLDVSSPGGSATAAAMLQGAIEDRNKPIITLITGYAASGAYWGPVGSDEIIAASKTVEIGSIGAYMVLDKKAMQMYRERFMQIYSDLSPDKNKEMRAALDNDFSGIKEMVNQTARDFHEVVTANRTLSGDRLDIKETLSGGMFAAEDARRRGLIDGIGGLNYALSRTEAWMKKRKK